MATTVKALIDSALRKIGAIGTGAQASPDEYADALMLLRQMIDSWSLERLMVPFVPTERFDLREDQAFYTMGPGGDWDTVRPTRVEFLRIEDAEGYAFTVPQTSPGIAAQQASIGTGRPTGWMARSDHALTYVELNAFPTDPHVLVTSLKPFTVEALENFTSPWSSEAAAEPMPSGGFSMTGIQTPISFPAGYESALVFNLAVLLHSEYPGHILPDQVPALAADYKRKIKRGNWHPDYLTVDRALLPGFGGYDITLGPVG